MRILCSILFLSVSAAAFGDDPIPARRFVTNERLVLGTEANRSASVRTADVDGNGTPDVIVANGRHWPGQNYVFLNQRRGRFTVQRLLGEDRRTSYAAEPADFDGDGDLDIAIGNDMAANHVLLNDGAGRFTAGSEFGSVSSLRSLTTADIDSDGDVDLLLTCRGRANQICLNDGRGKFESAGTFGTQRDSTIDVAVTDWNGDGHADLVLANRDSQPNAILINDGKLGFATTIPFGDNNEQTRAVAIADLNGDGHMDIVTGNIGQANRIYFADGKGKISESVSFGQLGDRSYSIAVADMDNDRDVDIVVANVGQPNAAYLNQGSGKEFVKAEFGGETNATYSVATGDFNGDGFADIVVANSDARNSVFLNQPSRADSRNRRPKKPVAMASQPTMRAKPTSPVGKTSDWPGFRGAGAKGVASGFSVRSEWNATTDGGEGVAWSVDVPGLAHSSPVIRGDRLYLATAIAESGNAPLKVGRGGRPDAADDDGEQSWVVLCYDRKTGKEIWRQIARKGKPRATRHVKATHANTSVTIDGDSLVAFFGSEGMYCYDLDGNKKWSRDLGVIDISKYGIGWGFASSPAIHGDHIVIVCDDPDNPFVAALKLSDGEEVWRQSRKDICVRSWGTPFVLATKDRVQAVVNGWPWIVSYDVSTGKEFWRIKGGGDNPVPTPFEANGWIYITNAHGAESPIFVVKPDASGDITPPVDIGSNQSVVWSTRRGGSYMSTPVVYGDYLYLGNTNGVLRCFHAKTGEKVYEKRLGSGAAIYSSLIAADGKIFCASENGHVYVVRAGSTFELLGKNDMGAPLFATPAVSDGTLYFRTTGKLIAIK
ncbi:MAG: FG-GAP-like repeat-containing protein [Planctomycetaceae bacterium]